MVRSMRAALSGAALCLIVAAAGLTVPAAATAAVSVQSVSLWKQNASPMAWSANPDRVYYNAVGPDGMYEGYSANPDGSDSTCVTCAAPSFPRVGTATQRSVADVSPDGHYMLLEVENPNHFGAPGEAISEPGKGAYNDVWLATADGSEMWPLTNVTAHGSGVIGTMWARFSPSGDQIVFDEEYGATGANLGYWQLVVANITWTAGLPSLTNETVIDPSPDHFMEPYGFSPDGSKVIFASDINQPSWMDSQIWEIGTNGSGLTQLSPEAQDGVFTNYNEFAFFLPSGGGIIYGRTVDSSDLGIDYWLMGDGGGSSQRLTFFNAPWSTEYQGYSIAGGLAFNPDDPDQFVAAVSQDATSESQTAVLVTLSDPASTGGLTAQYFSGSTDFQGAPVTTTGNPSSGFETETAPLPGISSQDYSIRWTGSITAPTAGPYTFCLMTDGGGQLYLGGRLLIDAQTALGQRVCGSTTAAAGQSLPVTLDYSHGQGDAYEQLTWIPPGAGPELSAVQGGVTTNWDATSTAGELIPSSDMTPGSGAGSMPAPAQSSPATTTTPGAGHTTTVKPKARPKHSKGATAVTARAKRHKRRKSGRRKPAKSSHAKPQRRSTNSIAKTGASNKSA